MAYAGTLVDWAESFLRLTIKPVSRPGDAKGFVVLPRRWVVERSLACLLHARRNARNYETPPQHSEAMLTLSAITLKTPRLTWQPIHPNSAVHGQRPHFEPFDLRRQPLLTSLDVTDVPAKRGLGRASAALTIDKNCP
ncbi:transposase [Streptomyces sp. SID161]|nr:transposase [Streptomyces sp. SID161]